jgi:tetratricopeptide (TPR) repeat protein
MKALNVVVLSIAILTSATVVRASVPIIVATPQRMRAAMKLVTDAQDLLEKGDVAGAKRNVDAVLQRDPTFWPALYVRAQIYSHEGKYDLALKDCNEALRQDRSVVEAALLRANINARLGKYAEALKEFDDLISLHPRNVTLARALSDRAWFRATCPDASFRNGQQAVKDAKVACSIMVWKDEHMIDTLAVAYAEVGDFNSAVQYVSQALAVKGISPSSAKFFQKHLALFQQQKPIRL